MTGIVFGCITPHPPIMLPQIGRGRESEVSASIEAMGRIARELAESQVDTVFIVSPHGAVYPDAMGLLTAPCSVGTMSEWGAMGIDCRFDNDPQIVAALQQEAKDASIPLRSIGEASYDLDHGVMVPAYFLIDVLKSRPLVPISFSALPLDMHLELGRAVARASETSGKRVALIASGDLSHRLIPLAPAGYDPAGQEFDKQLTQAVASLDSGALLEMDPDMVSRAGECGLRSIVILLGALEGLEVTADVLAYEGPFGVGYLTASFRVAEDRPEPRVHPLVQLARESVEEYVNSNTTKTPPVQLADEMTQQAGVFVSIKRGDELRGCVGTAEPITPQIAEEVIANAIGAATRDPRFSPITTQELPGLRYSVDVLSPLEPVSESDSLDSKVYGLLVRKGDKTGLLLPDLEQVKSPEQQLQICLAKAGIDPDDVVEMFRFSVERYRDLG